MRILALFAALAAGAGCGVTAQSLGPLAEQNQRNLTELKQTVEATRHINDALVAALVRTYLSERVATLDEQMIDVLGASSLDLAASDWEALFRGKQTQATRDSIKVLARTEPAPTLARRYGWLHRSAEDRDFKPAHAKETQKALATLQAMFPDARQSAEYITLAVTLLRRMDAELAWRVTITDELRKLLRRLNRQADQQLGIGQRHAEAFVKAADADVQLRSAVGGVLESPEAGGLVEELATREIDNVELRDGVIGLYRTFAASFHEPR